ncbi:hypothetical protein [Demequina sp.]|uniref:hypothetical protein n=1 Tax=Demequina sp. TaxID=2050685 RepID=UPI003A8476D5
MESLVCVALGAMLGYGVIKVHALIDGGALIGIAAGALGGWLGARWWGPSLQEPLADSSFAGAVAGGAIGAVAFALLAGIGVGTFKAWRRSQAAARR